MNFYVHTIASDPDRPLRIGIAVSLIHELWSPVISCFGTQTAKAQNSLDVVIELFFLNQTSRLMNENLIVGDCKPISKYYARTKICGKLVSLFKPTS